MEPKKINDYQWEIDADNNEGMRVPVRIYANEKILKYMQRDRTLRQAVNAAKLPSVVRRMMVMPDGHEGYGFPVGGVIAFDAENGIVSPAINGYDINCGIRIIKTNMSLEDIKPKLNHLMDSLFKNVPSGVGSKVNLGFTQQDIGNIVAEGDTDGSSYIQHLEAYVRVRHKGNCRIHRSAGDECRIYRGG